MKKTIIALTAMLASAGFSLQGLAATKASDKARDIAKRYIMVDGHIDAPYRLYAEWADISQAVEGRDFDYPRARAGGLDAPFMSIYVPASYDDSKESTAIANRLIDSVEAIVSRAPDKFAIARNPTEIKQQFEQGLISLPLGLENGSPVQGSLDTLRHFYERGIRYITLAHSLSNHIADSSYDIRRKWKGLSPFGKEMVAEMNRLGIMVDVSHISDKAFYQVMELSKVPVIASHSSLRKFTPGFERNMSDDMVKALARNNGVIMINFGSGFIHPLARSWRDKLTARAESIKEEHGRDSEQYKAFVKRFREANPYPFASLDLVLDHIDHVVELVGIEHVGLGSDFDGVGNSLPEGLKDVSQYPNLIQGLLDRGYSEKDIAKIMGQNALRVWSEVEQYAQRARGDGT